LEAVPVEIEAIACGENLRFERGHLSGCDARLIRGDSGQGFARISDKIPEQGRVRFALAHELGHFMLHVGLSQVQACTSGDLSDYRRNPHEAQANTFASEILMPTASFRSMAAKVGPTFEDIGVLADRFNVSMTAAIIRYIDLGPIHEMVLVAFGADRRVIWSKSRRDGSDFWMDYGMEASRRSMAFCAFEAGDSVEATTVDSDVWFHGHDEIAVTEECLFMPDYGSLLSLLVIDRE
jgi:hypothetical protein